jgi:hypothetical protein
MPSYAYQLGERLAMDKSAGRFASKALPWLASKAQKAAPVAKNWAQRATTFGKATPEPLLPKMLRGGKADLAAFGGSVAGVIPNPLSSAYWLYKYPKSTVGFAAGAAGLGKLFGGQPPDANQGERNIHGFPVGDPRSRRIAGIGPQAQQYMNAVGPGMLPMGYNAAQYARPRIPNYFKAVFGRPR